MGVAAVTRLMRDPATALARRDSLVKRQAALASGANAEFLAHGYTDRWDKLAGATDRASDQIADMDAVLEFHALNELCNNPHADERPDDE